MQSLSLTPLLASALLSAAALCGVVGRSQAVEPGLRPDDRRRAEEPMQAQGKVTEFAQNPHGEVDGLLLDDETVVKVPPHEADALQELVRIGDKVSVDGRRHETPEGEIHLHADRISVAGKKEEWVREEPARRGPPPAPAGAKGKPPVPPHARGELEGPRGRAGEPAPGVSNDELLRELRAIRQLLEERR